MIRVFIAFGMLTVFAQCRKSHTVPAADPGVDTAAINKLNRMSWSMRKNDQDSSALLAKNAIDLSSEANYIQGLGDGYLRLGWLENNSGNYTKAIGLFRQSLYYRQTLNDAPQIASVYANIGTAYKDSAVYDSSIYYHTKAILISDSIADLSFSAKYRNNLGIAHDKFKNYQQALQYYQESLHIREQLHDTAEVAQSCINISSAYYNLGKYDSALVYLRRVFANKELLSNNSIAITYNNAGLNYERLHKNDSAVWCYKTAATYYRDADDRRGLATSLSNLGIFCLVQDSMDSCYHYLKESTELAEEESMTELLGQNYHYLGDYYANHRIFDTASLYYAKAIKYDSVITEETDHQIRSYAEIQTKFETEKARQEFVQKEEQHKLIQNIIIAGSIFSIIIVSLLFSRRQLRKKLEYQKQLERHRTLISSDLHDDIGAALSSISMYSDVIKNHVDNSQFTEADALLNEIASTSRELMDNMSDLVWAINPVNDNFERIIHRTKSFSYRILQNKNIHLHFHADENLQYVNLSMEARHNLFMICKEAINNAAKYSNAQNVYLSIHNNGKQIITEIRDDGDGFEMQAASDGNGLKNMKRRAADIGAAIEMHSERGKGTTIRIVYTFI